MHAPQEFFTQFVFFSLSQVSCFP